MTPQQATRQIALAAVVTIGIAATSAAANRPPDTTATASPRAVIHGCEQEDSCRANYHANGTWTIRIAPH